MKKMVVFLILVALIINSASFCLARAYWYCFGGLGADLEVERPADDNGVMYYLVAGNVNQPRQAFAFLVDRLHGGITYVTYRGTRGCDMQTIAAQVMDDAEEHGYTARIIGISIGDYVGRVAEAEFDDVETVAINPEANPRLLQTWARVGTRIASPVMEIVSIPLGWLSTIPFISTCKGTHFSLVFLADQWWEIAYINDAPEFYGSCRGAICSTDDQFLDNENIEEAFKGVIIEYAESDHGNTVDKADAYIKAWAALGLDW